MIKNILIIVALLFICYLIYIEHKRKKKIEEMIEILKDIKKGKSQQKLLASKSNSMSEVIYLINEIVEEKNIQIELLEKEKDGNKKLLTSLAHDLRTPLTILIGYMDAIHKKVVEGEEKQNYFEIARSKSYQLKQYVDRLFEWSKLYSNEYKIYKEYIDISDLTRRILIDWIPVFEESGIDYKIDIPEYEININMDIRAYETLLLNIIQNVIDHSRCNNIIIELTNSDDSIMMRIKDDGIGISEEELIHIFDRLYKIDTSRRTSGNGLGLSIVKQIIENLGGNVMVNSELNQGMELKIRIPKNSR